MLNLSSNVLLEMVLIEGWTAECIFTRIVHGSFFVWKEMIAKKSFFTSLFRAIKKEEGQ
jgi:hypothetical protein